MFGLRFWLFQNYIPAIFSITPSLLLLMKHDQFGFFDTLAQGAIGFIGVLLLFALSLEIRGNPHVTSERDAAADSLLGIGTALLIPLVALSVEYAREVSYATHVRHMELATAEELAHYFFVACVAVYFFSFAAAFVGRRRARMNGWIS